MTAVLPLWAACSLAPAGLDAKIRVNLGGQSSFSAHMNNALLAPDPSGLFAAGGYPPDINQYECFMLNVDGDGIAPWNPDSRWYNPKNPHSCRYPGVSSAAISSADPSGVVEMSVPAGAARLVQVLGFNTSGNGCAIGKDWESIERYLQHNAIESSAFWSEVGWTSADLFTDTTLDITSTYDYTNPVMPWTTCAPPPSGGVYDQMIMSAGGLQAYWRLDETAGPQAYDLGPFHFNGSYNVFNSVVGVLSNDMAQFFAPGANMATAVTSSSALNQGPVTGPGGVGTGGFTFEFWIQGTGFCGVNTDIARAQSSVAYKKYSIGCGPTGVYTNVQDDVANVDNAAGTTPTTTTLTDGNWHLLTAVRDNNQNMLILYMDGSSIGSTAMTAGQAITPDQGFSTVATNVTLDEIAIFNRALTQTEIHNHYLYPGGGGPPP